MLSVFFNVFGGLAIFIFGMKMMSDGLHIAAGERMRSILRFFSANRFVAILSGALVTMVIQSSSASTVMVIGFINAGLLTLVQAVGIICGANIGTTVTAQIVAFDIQWIIMPSIILGLLMLLVSKPILKGWGETVIGLGFLFLGMSIMSGELSVLAKNESFTAAFHYFDCQPVNGCIPVLPLLGAIGIGIAATFMIQSSSACTGIIIALGASGILNIYTAVALVLGSNIGTTVTAQLAALTANRVAKQAALAHTLFNVIGVLLIGCTFWITWGASDVPLFFRAVNALSGDGDLPRHIANAHTLFNVCTTLVLIPFIPLLANICEKIIPVQNKVKLQRLEPHLLDTPAIALAQSVSVMRRMLGKSWLMVDRALESYSNPLDREARKELSAKEEQIDELQQEISDYLAKLMQRSLVPAQTAMIPPLLHCTNDAERVGDHTKVILQMISDFHEADNKLSKSAEAELEMLRQLLDRQAQCAMSLLEKPEREQILLGEQLKREIIEQTAVCEKNHLKRLNEGTCTGSVGVFYIELLSEVQKVSRHFGNITDRAAIFAPVQ